MRRHATVDRRLSQLDRHAGLPGQATYVMSHEANLVGVLFGESLRAGENLTGPSNKILWIVREPRAGGSLELALRRLDGTGEPVTVVRPADSGPGEICPSIVDVPEPGCWRVEAVWSGHRASVLRRKSVRYIG
ncbi:MAG: hypothetical protein QOE61_171 [Micromonosporaceae bacterium]|jgi:hypothetical protein|nr:hypothetical protein [Micromonosporaceae bacterium]